MGTERHGVYNRSRGTFLSTGVDVIDTTKESFRALIEDLAQSATTGLWLRPFRGIPEARNLPRFDLLYLDENQTIIKATESFSAHEFAPFSGRVASALALPPKTISSTQTQMGDQLKIATAEDEEMAGWLATPAAGTVTAMPETAKPAAVAPQVQGPAAKPTVSDHAFELPRKQSLLNRFRKWLDQDKQEKDSNRRRAERRALPGLIAYYWTGGAPQSFQLNNISLTGLYLLTDERWVFETVIQMRLQRTDKQEEDAEGSVPVLAKVVRWGVDGVGLQFIFSEPGTPKTSMAGTNLEDLLRFLRGLSPANSGG